MAETRWEYATLVMELSAARVGEGDPRWESFPAAERASADVRNQSFLWLVEQRFYIWLPEASAADERLAWSSTGGSLTSGSDILNELGRDRWELVSETVLETRLGESRGYPTVGSPIKTRSTLKRPVSEA